MNSETKQLARAEAQPILLSFTETLARLRVEGVTEADIEAMLAALEYNNRDLPPHTLQFIMEAFRHAAFRKPGTLARGPTGSLSADRPDTGAL